MNPEECEKLKSKYLPVFKFLRKKKLPIKYARVGDQRVEYFRVEEVRRIVDQNKAHIQSMLHTAEDPLEVIQREATFCLARPVNTKSLKYPQVLDFSPIPSQFVSFRFSTEQSKRWLMVLIVAVILFVVLFPIWPYELKYTIWLTSLILLIVMGGIITLRLSLYSILSLFGYSFWIFPNLFTDSSIIESFKPTLSIERWEKSKLTLVLRLAIFACFVYYGYQIYRDPSFVFENFKHTKEAVIDIHDWGVGKIKYQKNFTQRALTGSLQKILNETQEAPDREKPDNQPQEDIAIGGGQAPEVNKEQTQL